MGTILLLLPIVHCIPPRESSHPSDKRPCLRKLESYDPTPRPVAAGRRQLSLVDCVSFEVMRRIGLNRAFCLDPHFEEQGFEVLK